MRSCSYHLQLLEVADVTIRNLMHAEMRKNKEIPWWRHRSVGVSRNLALDLQKPRIQQHVGRREGVKEEAKKQTLTVAFLFSLPQPFDAC